MELVDDGQGLGRLLDAAGVARWLGVSREFIYAKARSGELPSVRLGRRVRFRRETVAQFLEDVEAGRVQL